MTPLPHLRRVLLGLVLLGLAVGFTAQAAGGLTLTHGAWDAPAAANRVSGLRRGTMGVDVIALIGAAKPRGSTTSDCTDAASPNNLDALMHNPG